MTQPNIGGETRPSLPSYYETGVTSSGGHSHNKEEAGVGAGYREQQQFPVQSTVISRQETHLLNQVTNNNTPALVAQALSGKLNENTFNLLINIVFLITI